MRVAVLHGAVPPEAPPDEQDVLVEVAAVSQALAALGHEPVAVPLTLDLDAGARALRGLAPAVVFNLVESLEGTGRLNHLAPALLDHLGLAYTGAPTDALYLTSQKILTKRWLASAGVATPAWASAASAADLPGPCIVKSVWEEASVGIDDASVVRDPAGAAAELGRRARAFGGEWFAEAFVEGREFNISVLAGEGGVDVLPPAEIDFTDFPEGKPRIVGYRAKWDDASFEFHHTPRRFDLPASDRPLLEHLAEVSRRCWETFGLRGYARVDFRVDRAGEPWVLEINANPCLSPDSGFVAAAAAAGLGYGELVARILAGAAHG
ncbi:MAG: ATP-grasp domain-containing protein [Deltaproteobacteria bacterium]|nr:ATP-grasp domain-containing protein [Deltaproteobacteria bacterium]